MEKNAFGVGKIQKIKKVKNTGIPNENQAEIILIRIKSFKTT